jgi:Pentapeptide repeats (8 copies)
MTETLVCRVARGEDLSGQNLSGQIFTGMNLTHARLNGADLSSCMLGGANFTHADLRGADLSETDMDGTRFRYANMVDVNIKDSAPETAVFLACDGIVDAGTDWRGYRFIGVWHTDGSEWHVKAGCRWFTLGRAFDHWEQRENADALMRVALIRDSAPHPPSAFPPTERLEHWGESPRCSWPARSICSSQ